MKEIGGYFELELPESHDFPNSNGILVNSGRHALEYLIRSLGDKIKRIYIPYYTCDVVIQPLLRNGIEYKFYSISKNLEIAERISLNDGEYLIANNYFGIKDSYVYELANYYKHHLFVDNAQAFFCTANKNANYIYSPRKFFGIPDGGILLPVSYQDLDIPNGISFDRFSHLIKRIDMDAGHGYLDFKANSQQLKEEPLTRMSQLTERLLGSINYEKAIEKRRANYNHLHSVLSSTNELQLPDINSFSCPMVYPYMTADTSIRKKLIDNKIFVATYWPNVLEWCTPDMLEYQLANQIIPLPIDQRYDREDMIKIINIINRYSK